MDIEKTKARIVQGLRDVADTAVIGLSGGADSLLTTLVCIDALGRENVYTYSLPYSDLDLKTFNTLSKMYADHLKVNHGVVNIGVAADKLNGIIAGAVGLESPDDLSTVNAGNARARSRMCVLYGVAHHLNEKLKNRVRVIGTGNLSEDFIGYDTKGGDALADIFPIGELFKSEVYLMLEHYRDNGTITEEMINRTPSAGLWANQTDEDELGHTYNDMEPAIRHLLANYGNVNESELSGITRFVWEKHLANKHKHEAPPVIKLRDDKGNMIG